MEASFTAGLVEVEVLPGLHPFSSVPPSQWRGNRVEVNANAVLANFRARDGLRAQIALVMWPDGDEVSVGHAELFAGPRDYERLEDAGTISPKRLGDHLVARIRALKYNDAARATGTSTTWAQIDAWAAADSRTLFRGLGATAAGAYGELLPTAVRFKAEPSVKVPLADPRALFAAYAITRVVPIMTGYGKPRVQGPNA